MSEAKEKEKAKLPISTKEFKMWLQGVEEMQTEEWVPDARQWKLIRAKIELIENTPAVPAVYRDNPRATGGLPPGAELVFPPMNTAAPAPRGAGAVPLPSGLHVAAGAPAAPRNVTTPSGVPVSMESTGRPNVPVKTPDVDTSDGNYNSQFA